MLALRKAEASDAPVILALVKALAVYEKEPDAVLANEEDFLREGFGPEPHFQCLLAYDPEDGGRVVGLALYCFTFSTWKGRRRLFLEDLFVVPEARKRGAGLMLMRALARETIRAECKTFMWQVLDWNQLAIDFYERLGAYREPQWQNVRLEGEALAALAASAGG